jgi:phage-related minor tail protein
MTQIDGITVVVEADTRAFRREINQAAALANGFGATLTRAFEGAIVRGRDFGEVLRALALRLSSMAIGAALKPLEQGFGGLMENLLTGKGAPTIGAPMNITPFASGGVIAAPTYFPLASALGLAGERGAEAILPLSRGADGKLGVRAEGNARPLTVSVNVSTPDASSFRRSEAYLSGVIARAVARGERSL